jgi:hypothetical protein
MMRYPNFYENLKEAQARLLHTVVLYDGMPYYVLAITDHKGDGIFRVYLSEIGRDKESQELEQPFFNNSHNFPSQHSDLGPMMDELMEKHPTAKILRKYMNSSAFNNFRPFPLGMCNVGTQTYYLERQPIRPSMNQGLTKGAFTEALVTAGSRDANPKRFGDVVGLMSVEFRDCIVGNYVSAEEVLYNLRNPQIANDTHAFHREFALVRGPLEMLFLGYRADVIGILPNGDFSEIKLGRDFRYCREAVEELHLFGRVRVE